MLVFCEIWTFDDDILKSSFWLFFVRNCKYVVLSRFSDSWLLLNQVFTAIRVSFTLLIKTMDLGLATIKLVSSAYSISLTLLPVTSANRLYKAKKVRGQGSSLVEHHALLFSSPKM
jgi:hypothetical protein